jgi:V8-like Glu-specific endopeptidase
MEQLSIFEQLCFCTTRIETVDNNGISYSGTGFFFNLKIDEQRVAPLLITNKHVVRGMKKGFFRITTADQNGNPNYQKHFTISFEQDFEKMWIFHPQDDIDLCALPINVLVNAATQLGNKLFFKSFDNTLIPSSSQIQSFDAIEDIIMIGYPNGLWDSQNNMPIIRRGITATQIKLDYNGQKAFLIDASVFPGSSGSPVLICNNGGYTDKYGNLNWGQSRIFLLGIVNSVFLSNVSGNVDFVTLQTQQLQLIANSRIPNNIGNVIKAEVLLDFIPLFKTATMPPFQQSR